MIEYLRGKIAELNPAQAVIDVNGVGYDVNISFHTYSMLEGKDEAKLYVVENIREDAWVLFGFGSKEERTLFNQLTSVSGVGGASARLILSAMSPAELSQAIVDGNERLLTNVKGIGKRTAQRIIVELHDKIDLSALDLSVQTGARPAASQMSEQGKEAVQALSMLGFPASASRKVVESLLAGQPDMKVEQIIKLALKAL